MLRTECRRSRASYSHAAALDAAAKGKMRRRGGTEVQSRRVLGKINRTSDTHGNTIHTRNRHTHKRRALKRTRTQIFAAPAYTHDASQRRSGRSAQPHYTETHGTASDATMSHHGARHSHRLSRKQSTWYAHGPAAALPAHDPTPRAQRITRTRAWLGPGRLRLRRARFARAEPRRRCGWWRDAAPDRGRRSGTTSHLRP